MLAVNKGHEESARLAAQNVLQDSGANVGVQFLAGRVLAVLQQAGIATTGGRRACLFDFVVGRIGKSQNQMLELLIELVLVGQPPQAPRLLRRGWNQAQAAVTHEHRARNSSLYRRDKTNGSRMQVKSSGVALEL